MWVLRASILVKVELMGRIARTSVTANMEENALILMEFADVCLDGKEITVKLLVVMELGDSNVLTRAFVRILEFVDHQMDCVCVLQVRKYDTF